MGATSTGLRVRLNQGNGVFGSSTTYSAGAAFRSVSLGDINNDGIIDAVGTTSNFTNVGIFIGQGNGTFQAPSLVDNYAARTAIELVDLNNDGNLDMLTNGLEVFLGNGNGTFKAHTSYTVSGSNQRMFIGDLNGDGHIDAISNSLTGQIYLSYGDGKGGFGSASQVTITSGANYISGAQIADVNYDGLIDIVTSDFTNDKYAILLGNGMSGTSEYLSSGPCAMCEKRR